MDAVDRRRLVDEHSDLVIAIASRVHASVGRYMDKEDLVAWGNTGLLEAAERFDPGLGVAFPTFAYYRVRGAMYDGMRRMTHLPRDRYRQLVAAGRASDYLEHAYTRSAARTRAQGAPPDTAGRVRELYDAARAVATAFVVSLDDADACAAEPPQEWMADPGAALDRKRLVDRLRAAIGALPERERHFIERCYYEGDTVADAGRALGLSRSWSSRLHARAVDRLRDLLAAEDPA